MAADYQHELFEEFTKEKGKFEKIADRITHRKKKLYVHMPLENIVFAVIVVVMCVIVAFALGVERGKRHSDVPTVAAEKTDIPEVKAHVGEETKPPKKIELEPIEVKKPVKKKPVLPYTVQLISYKQKSYAEDERKKLLKKNIEAFILSAGDWHQVCAGKYGNMDEAKAAQKVFSRDYKGCFIRRR